MKYNIDRYYNLFIHNDSGKRIFGINKYNYWEKYDYDQYGTKIYYEDVSGGI